MTSLSLALDQIHPNLVADDAAGLVSPQCHAYLLIHQPDLHWPDRLLGTCSECRTWFLISAATGVIVRLPDEEDLGRARATSLARLPRGLPDRSAASPGITAVESQPRLPSGRQLNPAGLGTITRRRG